jgi:hypothetical protein
MAIYVKSVPVDDLAIRNIYSSNINDSALLLLLMEVIL